MLVELLEREAVPFETLHSRYGSLLELVRKLPGVVPHCDPYPETCPPALRPYHAMAQPPSGPVPLASARCLSSCASCSASCPTAILSWRSGRRLSALTT